MQSERGAKDAPKVTENFSTIRLKVWCASQKTWGVTPTPPLPGRGLEELVHLQWNTSIISLPWALWSSIICINCKHIQVQWLSLPTDTAYSYIVYEPSEPLPTLNISVLFVACLLGFRHEQTTEVIICPLPILHLYQCPKICSKSGC